MRASAPPPAVHCHLGLPTTVELDTVFFLLAFLFMGNLSEQKCWIASYSSVNKLPTEKTRTMREFFI